MTDHELFDITRLDEPEIHFNAGADVSPHSSLAKTHTSVA